LILLTHGYFLEEDEKEKQIMRPYVPLGILYISAYLESKDIAHEVFDSTFSTLEKFKSNLLSKKPRLIGFYTNLMTKISVLKIINFIKANPELNECKIILGGPEIRYNAENYLQNGADILVVGEGEQTFFEICESFLKTGSIPKEVHGTAYLESGKLVFTTERTLIKDINVLPMPARKNIDLALYGNAWKKHHGYSMFSVSTMRGCPYTCKWCSRAVYGGTYRRRSAKLVVDEMEYLKLNYAPDRIWFVDDVFTINHKWLKEFRDEVLKRNVIIPFEIITRADRMNEEVIQILKEVGCFRVWIGAESGSQKIIDAMDRRVEVKMVREMIIKTKKAGIEAGTFIMLGYPGEKRADIKETINHLNISDPSFYTITVAYPITGTPLYNEVNGSLQSDGPWVQITDREYDFKRQHSKKFYLHAIDWVYNEVNYNKSNNLLRKLKFKSKSFIAQALMLVS
jgi:anaerobic magnesium-protoporphyrin IX monomethyl ester cyclase